MASKGFLSSIGITITNDKPAKVKRSASPTSSPSVDSYPVSQPSRSLTLTREECDKFEKHFDQLLEAANLPGPDYYEFTKVDETLEAAISDEKLRMTTAFKTLSVQGPSLTKQILIDSAAHYIDIVKADKEKVETILKQKQGQELTTRKQKIDEYQKKIEENQDAMQRFIKENNDLTATIQKLTAEVNDVAANLSKSESAYLVACDAMIKKIDSDVQKINSNL
jgi:predicted RNase H-like nuclease (RuvC/YqgF family)